MNKLSLNVLANLAGKLSYSLLMLIAMPLLARLIGVEGYGLVGFFVSLQMVLMTLEGGLTASFNREISRLAGLGDFARVKQTTTTFLLLYSLLGLVIFLIVYGLAALVATDWFPPGALQPAIIRNALVWMGATIGVQFLVNLYQACFAALERQVMFNAAYILFSVARTIGVVFGLKYWQGDVVDFFASQFVLQIVFCVSLHAIFWTDMAHRKVELNYRNAAINLDLLRSHFSFGGQMILISVLSSLILQSDKFLLSKFAGLKELGYYNMAYLIASMPYIFSSALFAAIFPRATRLVTTADEPKARQLFDQATQVVAVLVLPASLFLGYFAHIFLAIWIGDPTTVKHVAPVLSILLAGVAIQSLQVIPYAFQLAHKWSSLTLKINLMLMPLVLVGYALGSRMLGGLGTAIVWLSYSLVTSLLIHIFMHMRILYDARLTWIKHALAAPSLVSLVILLVVALLVHLISHPLGRIVLIFAGVALATACSAMLSPALRPFILRLNRFHECS